MKLKKHTVGQKYKIGTRRKAFDLWRKNGQNCAETARQMEKKYGQVIQVSTIMRWRDSDDWDAKVALVENEFKKLLRNADDPVLQQLALDDLEMAKVLRQIERICQLVLKKPKRHGLLPKNPKDLIALLDFARTERKSIMGIQESRKVSGVTVQDNRKLNIIQNVGRLSPDQQRSMLRQMTTVFSQESPALQEARNGAFAEEEK
jgi:hypothetical protein